MYQYKDHLGNIRLSYSDNAEILADNTFDTNTEGWGGTGTVLSWEDGKLKAQVTNQWSGAQKYVDVAVGDRLYYEFVLDKGTTENLMVYIAEHDNNYAQLNSTMVLDGADGFISGTYTVTEGSKLRIKINKNGSDNGIATHYYVDDAKIIRKDITVREEKSYYPFGLAHRGYNNQVTGTHYPYTFNGKEEQQELDLNWIDYGWRNYDASLGRWMNMDPLAELMRKHSPYNYALNNPVYYVDIAGLSPYKSAGLMDYYQNPGTGEVFYDPNVHGPDDVPDGATYIGPTYTDPTTGTFWDENGQPHTQTQRLDEVVVTGKSKSGDGITTDGLRVWGVGGRGANSSAAGGIVTGIDRGSGSVSVRGSDINPFFGLIWWVMSHWFTEDDNTPEPNESTMEQQPEEEPKQQHPYTYFLDPYKNGRKDYPRNAYSSEQTDAIEAAKDMIKEDKYIDSVVIKPFYSGASLKDQIRIGRDTTIVRN